MGKTIEDILSWNKNEQEYPQNVCLSQLFIKQAKVNPSNIAVIAGDSQITYKELDKISGILANYLAHLGVKANVPVGILLTPSIDIVVAILAVMKAGGTYVPIDDTYPSKRVTFMLEQARAKIVITCEALALNPSAGFCKITMDTLDLSQQKEQSFSFCHVDANDRIYILYTSGSTGKPKGAGLYYRGVANLLYWYIESFRFNQDDRILVFSSFGFDLTQKNVLGGLISGATIYILPPEQYNPLQIKEMIQKYRITLINCTPSVFYPILTEIADHEKELLHSLRYVFLGGETINPKRLLPIIGYGLPVKIVNTYGPTECSDIACSYIISESDIKHNKQIPLGKSIPNVKVVILDENMRILPANTKGEIYLAGMGIGAGYINDDKLTQQKFVKNPFQQFKEEWGGILYKTGDFGEWDKEGRVHFKGRVDDQVKLRGLRIELSEIETVLNSIEGVKQAVVTIIDERLTACYTTHNNITMEIKYLSNQLAEYLPKYMVPTHFHHVEEFIYNKHGKIDKQALPKLLQSSANIKKLTNTVQPRCAEEEILLEIWADLLNCNPQQISIHDNFFNIGGYSLLATQVGLRISKIYNIQLPLHLFFQHLTIADLAKHLRAITNMGPNTFPPIQRHASSCYPLTYAQKRIWLLTELYPNSPNYNLPIAIEMDGKLDYSALKKTISFLIERHSVLRTVFYKDETGAPKQKIVEYKGEEFLQLIDLTKYPLKKRIKIAKEVIDKYANLTIRIEHYPLFYFKLLKIDDTKHILFLNIHHIVFDGWSWNVFKKEFSNYYNGLCRGSIPKLENTGIKYTDYAAWQDKNIDSIYLSKYLDFWVNFLKDAKSTSFPADLQSQANAFFGKQITIKLGENICTRLRKLASFNNVTFFTLLLSVFNILLYKLNGDDDQLVGTAVANRLHPETEKIIGLFINVLPIRTLLSENMEFIELLRQNQKTLSQIYSYQELPFEKIVEMVNPNRNITSDPLIKTMFIFQNTPHYSVNLDGLRTNHIEIDTLFARYDLEWQVWLNDKELVINLFYNANLFSKATAKNFLDLYRVLLESIHDNADTYISEVLFAGCDKLAPVMFPEIQRAPEITTVYSKFQTNVQRQSNAIAAVCKETEMKYRELYHLVNAMALYFTQQGIAAGQIVAIMADRSIELLAALLAIIKIGAVFVPLDIQYPKKRLQFILQDAKPDFFITQKQLQEKLDLFASKIMFLDGVSNTYDDAIIHKNLTTPDDIAYIMYTSGSAGTPKGVMVRHKSLCNTLQFFSSMLNITEADNFAAITSIAFDISLLELLLPIFTGASVTIFDQSILADSYHLWEKVALGKITIVQATPSVWKWLIKNDIKTHKNLKILCGGEALNKELANGLLKITDNIWNVYGPTEATIWCLYKKITNGQDVITIGQPIDNTFCYIFDQKLNRVPYNCLGELYIGGVNLAAGYCNAKRLTEQRFVKNPLSKNKRDVLYKTGDLVRQLPSGDLIFVGRNDEQVKINGCRIELGELEKLLQKHVAVWQAVATADIEESHLSAYVVLKAQIDAKFIQKIQREHAFFWCSIFDGMYSTPSPGNSDFIGWNSSYTGKQIPQHEMQEWLNCTVVRIYKKKPKTIFEIGCGLGLIIKKLLPFCDHYYACDLSSNVVQYLKNKFLEIDKKLEVWVQSHLNDLTLPSTSVDMVILNSIVQYFPSGKYLLRLLKKIITSVNDGGYIFLGDIRNLQLLSEFYKSIWEYKNNNRSLVSKDMDSFIQEGLNNEHELVIDPKFFVALRQYIPQIQNVEIMLKRGKYKNELTKFRYDVFLKIGKCKPKLYYFCKEWEPESHPMQKIINILQKRKPKVYAIKNIVNARNVHYIGKALQPSIDPEKLCHMAEELGYCVDIRLAYDNAAKFHAIFIYKGVIISNCNIVIKPMADVAAKEIGIYFNNPLKITISRHLQEYLKGYLPHYMLPSKVQILDILPTSPSGKLDKGILRKIGAQKKKIKNDYVKPKTYLEKKLAKIWREILQISQIGINDNFFDLGGHSFLAVELISKINTQLNVSISLYTFYKESTISNLIKNLISVNKENKNHCILLSDKQWNDQLPNPPLLLIPPIDGQIGWYKGLVTCFDSNLIVYGVCIKRNMKSHLTMQEMAELYVRKILEELPSKRYLLCGWSFGALLALEIFENLAAKGVLVPYIGLIDLPILDFENAVSDMTSILKKFARQAHDIQKGGVSPIIQSNLFTMSNYKIKTSHNNAVRHLYFPSSSIKKYGMEKLKKYCNSYFGEKMKFYSINGDHYSILQKDSVKYIGQLMKKEILRISNQSSMNGE